MIKKLNYLLFVHEREDEYCADYETVDLADDLEGIEDLNCLPLCLHQISIKLHLLMI